MKPGGWSPASGKRRWACLAGTRRPDVEDARRADGQHGTLSTPPVIALRHVLRARRMRENQHRHRAWRPAAPATAPLGRHRSDSRYRWRAASPNGMPCRAARPAARAAPAMLMNSRIRMPAIASPRERTLRALQSDRTVEVGFLRVLPAQGGSARLRRVSRSNWALRSASIAICLPGMASRGLKRGSTSEMGSAPLVMTTKLMMVRIVESKTGDACRRSRCASTIQWRNSPRLRWKAVIALARHSRRRRPALAAFKIGRAASCLTR